MATIRTPSNPTKDRTPEKPTAGPSTSSVRRSIGEWETTGKQIPKTRTVPRSPTGTGNSNRVQEARNQVQVAKRHLTESRNLKGEIKEAVTQAINKLYLLVKEAEDERVKMGSGSKTADHKVGKTDMEKEKDRSEGNSLIIDKMKGIMEESEKRWKEQEDRQKEHITQMEDLKKALSEHKEALQNTTTYASVTAPQTRKPPPKTLHSVVITSKDDTETGEEVMDRVRKAVDAKEGWITVERVRKAKDRKVIMGFATKEEREKVKDRLGKEGVDLTVEEVKNRDPLLVLRNVLKVNTDADILMALRNQNRGVFRDLDAEEDRVEIKYRKRARNPHTGHVVIAVSPTVWRRAIELGSLHIDLRRVPVEDQSPLVQCTRCLGYGHGKRFCKDPADLCSHCGGPHMKTECPEWRAEVPPRCRNCTKANLEHVDHNAFSTGCPVRRKWDEIARSTVAYC